MQASGDPPHDHPPWRAGKVLQESQMDFNYLEVTRLEQDAQVSASGLRLSGMHYRAVVLDWARRLRLGIRMTATGIRSASLPRWDRLDPMTGMRVTERR